MGAFVLMPIKKLSLLVCICVIIVTTSSFSIDQTLLIFLDTQGEKFDEDEGLNVAYQLLTAMSQQAAPILTTQAVWNHVLNSRNNFQQQLSSGHGAANELLKLYEEVNKKISIGLSSVQEINETYDKSWYDKNFRLLSKHSEGELKLIKFHFFCYNFKFCMDNWKFYLLDGGYLLMVPAGIHKNELFRLHGEQLLTYEKLMISKVAPYRACLDFILKKYLNRSMELSWSFYLTGHGHHKGKFHAQSMIAGMSVSGFRDFLLFLNNDIKTKVLVYSSCYSSGMHAIEPYQQDDKDLVLRYLVFVTCLTDGPMYIFGIPSGVKLPPYDSNNKLEESDVRGQGLQNYFIQNFMQFCSLLKSKSISPRLIDTISPYRSCVKEKCELTRLENIPLVRYAGSTYFVPLCSDFVTTIFKNASPLIEIENKAAILWYVKNYKGSIVLKGRLPQFISMVPGDSVTNIQRLDASAFDIALVIANSFFAVEDMFCQQIFLINELQGNLNLPYLNLNSGDLLKNVMIIPSGAWLPLGVDSKILGHVYFERLGNAYHLSLNDKKQIVASTLLTREQRVEFDKFRQLLIKECLFDSLAISTKKLLSSCQLKKRDAFNKKLFNECLQRRICQII